MAARVRNVHTTRAGRLGQTERLHHVPAPRSLAIPSTSNRVDDTLDGGAPDDTTYNDSGDGEVRNEGEHTVHHEELVVKEKRQRVCVRRAHPYFH